LRRSSQIAAYRRISTRIPDRGRPSRHYETPASRYIRGARLSQTFLIAMQKVEGSNPLRRFAEIPLLTGRHLNRIKSLIRVEAICLQ
jgi:hypothetical protein